MCETKSDWRSNWFIIHRPVNPQIVRGNVIECGPNTKTLGYRNETERIVLDRDSALAYSAVNDAAAAGRYNQALEKAQTIKNDSLRAMALRAITGE